MAAGARLDPSRGLVRGLRAAVLTVPAVGAASAAHSVLEGCASWLAMGLAAGLCWCAAVAMLGARRSLWAVVAWVLVAQVGTHVLLERMCFEVDSGRVSLSGHLIASLTPGLVVAHAGCAVATAVLLQHADTALWAASSLRRIASRLLATLVSQPAAAHVVRCRPPAPAPTVDLAHDLWRAPRPARRGPPALALR